MSLLMLRCGKCRHLDGIDSLRQVYDEAYPVEREVGMGSWWMYRRLLRILAKRHGFSFNVAAAVFSALSPNNTYFGNLRDVARVLAATRSGENIFGVRVSTFNPNKRKAFAIAHGVHSLRHPERVFTYPKTYNFYRNITRPNDPKYVTIDGHMHNAYDGRVRPLNQVAGQYKSPKRYEEVAQAVRCLAQAEDMSPCQMQAIIWHAWRRKIGFSGHQGHGTQMSLWCPEHDVIGVEHPGYETRGGI